ncbi:t19 [Tupaiid betaherpesvirus 1]|uniref:T19 n=1 Tax=Tupaiid herpesvirus 1 (strain 1) TaxID=10397 RepID=Q91TU2_TUHV1|nr:t19 [Tupaiid betaherpesvirus 1]AAK57045.1 t19 [Tupaiid betaherpesvirus 1]
MSNTWMFARLQMIVSYRSGNTRLKTRNFHITKVWGGILNAESTYMICVRYPSCDRETMRLRADNHISSNAKYLLYFSGMRYNMNPCCSWSRVL